MRNLNKKQNLVEQARIKLDKEKIAHSITLARVEELESIIKEVRKLLKNDYFEDGSFNNYEKVFELLDKVEGDKE